MGIGDWGLGIGPNPQSPYLQVNLLVLIIVLQLIMQCNVINNIIIKL